MAIYGPYYGAADNGRQLRVTIDAIQDVATNTSTVRAVVDMVSSNGSGRYSDKMQLTTMINGAWTVWVVQPATYGAGTYPIMDSYRVISHNADGNANATVVAAVHDQNGGFDLSVTVLTLTLPNIPRGTTPAISGGGGFTTGASSTISLPRANSGFTHDVTYKFGALTGTIATGAGVSTSWTPPHTLLTEIPNSVSGTVEITVVTKSGATVIGSKKVNFTLTAGASVVPTVSAVVWDDLNPVVKSVVGAFVQGQSLIAGAVPAAGVHGSTIVSKMLTIAGTDVSEAQVWEPATAGTITAGGRATDSRGRTGTVGTNFSVLAYSRPTFPTATVRRATTAAGAVGEGAYLRMDLTAAVQSLIVGTQKNALKLKVRTRPTGGAWTARNDLTHTGLSYSNALVMVTGGAAFPINSSFEVEITISDNLGQVATVTRLVGTGGASFDIAQTGTGHGKIHERGGIDVAGKGYFSDDVLVNDVVLSKVGHTHTGAQVTEATETARGTVERATQAEVNAGTDTTRYVSPKTLKNAEHLPFGYAAGVVGVTAVYTTVTFPVGRFTQPPRVGASIYASSSGQVLVPWRNGAATVTSFGIAGITLAGAWTNCTIDWTATQMTESNSNG